jgi:hypothetical protein
VVEVSKRIKIGQRTERDVQAMLHQLGRQESVGEFTGKLLAAWVLFHEKKLLERHTFDAPEAPPILPPDYFRTEELKQFQIFMNSTPAHIAQPAKRKHFPKSIVLSSSISFGQLASKEKFMESWQATPTDD